MPSILKTLDVSEKLISTDSAPPRIQMLDNFTSEIALYIMPLCLMGMFLFLGAWKKKYLTVQKTKAEVSAEQCTKQVD